MKKRRKPFPASTAGRRLPGVGTTITRANIDAHQAALAKVGREPADPRQIARTFTETPECEPTPARHIGRAWRLMQGKGEPQ